MQKIYRSADDWGRKGERSRVGDKKVQASWRRGNKRKKENKSKKEQLLKMLSWKCFRWPLTSNKSSVFLNTEKSLLTSELIPATVTRKNNKAHKNIKVHPLQLGGKKKKECIQFFRWKIFEPTEFIVMQLVLYVRKTKGGKNSPSSTFPWKTEYNAFFESLNSS